MAAMTRRCGSRATYNTGCRCDRCRVANTEWYRGHVARQRADAKHPQRRYPLDDLLAYVKGDDRTWKMLGELFDVNTETIRRWKYSGIPEYRADQLACAIGLHPATIWPTWIDDALGGDR